MTPFEQALTEQYLDQREEPPVSWSAHDREVLRLAELLWNEQAGIPNEQVNVPIGPAVYFVRRVLDSYRPQVEWTDETPEADPWNEDFHLRVGGLRFITARLRLGGRQFMRRGHLPARRGEQAAAESLRRHVRGGLGRDVVEWADGQGGLRP